MDNKSIIVVFNSKTHAYNLESILKKEGYTPIIYNAPGYLAESCSMAVKINESAYDFILQQIDLRKLDVFKIYKTCYEKNVKVYKVLKKY
ncbi:DUF3343 domain-containing protein [Paramaledivibacter caminithermalis]|jgi:hypothetical protein|uniref:Putative Se/S carrier protein-like domain-containing protein n=1 Tax=Paramaledivibacter caminithermalis (strain DSM 15212 / CIP 107654 / DViRD3) TaxID=1121301 RepID=A0A1M6JVD8_PARC5|nr:DUF3343 domain-containing protein [Paramaledivibacter caminithermalis]SHJ50674.1 Protein of unknown function [Paramaledivibacter caminithermalis DSM 15212]